MPKYLIRQRRRWYAVLEIPKAARTKFGKARFKQTLKTESLTLAEKRVRPLVAEWQSAIDMALSGATSDKVAEILEHVAQAKRDGYSQDEIADLALSALTVENGWGPADFPNDENAELFSVATGKIWPFKPYVAKWEKSLDQAPKTVDMKVSDVRQFVSIFPNAQDATSQAIIGWVEELMSSDGLSQTTVKRKVSAIKGFWTWLMRTQEMDIASPFANVVPTKSRATKTSIEARRKHFGVGDYHKLITASCKDLDLQNLIKLGAHTGARIEELCSLRTTKVTDDRIDIDDAKSEAGIREIPIHDDILELVAELKQNSLDGYLLSGLTANKYGDRSNAIGKRFGRIKTAEGFGGDYVFHSLRKSFARQLEEAGVPENITARLLGHEIKTMTYGLYSGGTNFASKKEAVNKLTYKLK